MNRLLPLHGTDGRWHMSALKVVLLALALVVPGGTLVLLAVAAFTALKDGRRSPLAVAYARLRGRRPALAPPAEL